MKGWSLVGDAVYGSAEARVQISKRDEWPRIFRLSSKRVVAYLVQPAEQVRVMVFPQSKEICILGHTLEIERDLLNSLLAEQVMPRILAHSGHMVVHASTVEINGTAVLFLAPTGSGKSTLGASFQLSGYDLLGDDAAIVALDAAGVTAEVPYPSLRLRSDSCAALYGEREGTISPFASNGKHRFQLAHWDQVPSRRVPVQAIIFLTGREANNEIQLRSCIDADACMGLVQNCFALDPTDAAGAQKRLATASAIASRVSCYQINYPDDFGALEQVRSAVLSVLGKPNWQLA